MLRKIKENKKEQKKICAVKIKNKLIKWAAFLIRLEIIKQTFFNYFLT